MHAIRTAVILVVALLCLGGCPSVSGQHAPGGAVRSLGEPYKAGTAEDPIEVYLIRVQDEFRLIRCFNKATRNPETGEMMPPGCYFDVFRVDRAQLSDDPRSPWRWNTWYSVPAIPGLEINFLDPATVSYRHSSSR